MIDVLGSIAGTAIYASLTGVLIGFSKTGGRTKVKLFAAAALWGALIVSITAFGGFRPGVLGGIPGLVLAFTALLILLFAAWRRFEGFRNALLAVPLPALIGINATRLGGVFFLILWGSGRLSAPFAPSAGWGDILVASLAIPLAISVGRTVRQSGFVRLWNALGAVDLIVAVSLGALSAQGMPFRAFTEAPGTVALTTLPWVMIPTMIVPIFLLNHFVIARKVRVEEAVASDQFSVVAAG